MSEMQGRVKELERKLADAPAERERELKKAEADLKRARGVAEKAVQAAAAKREVRIELGCSFFRFELHKCSNL